MCCLDLISHSLKPLFLLGVTSLLFVACSDAELITELDPMVLQDDPAFEANDAALGQHLDARGFNDGGSLITVDETTDAFGADMSQSADVDMEPDGALADDGERPTSEDLCEVDTCQNGGRCMVLGVEAVCECAAGFTGASCEDEEDICDPNPCANNGACRREGAGVRCECALGFGGTYWKLCKHVMTASARMAGSAFSPRGRSPATVDRALRVANVASISTIAQPWFVKMGALAQIWLMGFGVIVLRACPVHFVIAMIVPLKPMAIRCAESGSGIAWGPDC